jgi:hypothetical protein
MYFRIEHRVGVPASAQAIWAVLADLESWPEWNALYPKVSGVLRIGGKIFLTEQIADTPSRELQPTILDWVPDSQILWLEKTRLLKRTRYIEIEALAETGCIFANGEIFDGFGARFISAGRRRQTYAAFQAFGEALRAQVIATAPPPQAGAPRLWPPPPPKPKTLMPPKRKP